MSRVYYAHSETDARAIVKVLYQGDYDCVPVVCITSTGEKLLPRMKSGIPDLGRWPAGVRLDTWRFTCSCTRCGNRVIVDYFGDYSKLPEVCCACVGRLPWTPSIDWMEMTVTNKSGFSPCPMYDRTILNQACEGRFPIVPSGEPLSDSTPVDDFTLNGKKVGIKEAFEDIAVILVRLDELTKRFEDTKLSHSQGIGIAIQRVCDLETEHRKLEKCLNTAVGMMNVAVPKFDKDIDSLKDDVGLLKRAGEQKTEDHRSIPEIRGTCNHQWEEHDGCVAVFYGCGGHYVSCTRCGFAKVAKVSEPKIPDLGQLFADSDKDQC